MNSFIKLNPLSIMEEGSKFFLGLEEVIFKNIETCFHIRDIVSTSFGPEGMNKLISNEFGKTLITANTVDILKNLDLIHPILKLILYFSLNQESELGDSAGFVTIFGTELLKHAYELLKDGFHISDIIENFEEAGKICLKFLETLAIFKIVDLNNVKAVASLLSLTMGSYIQDLENYLAPQIAYACIKTVSSNKKNFTTDDIRVVKVLGGNYDQIKTITGTIVLRDTEGTVKMVKKANVVIFMNMFDLSIPETKSTLLFKSAEELMSFQFRENFSIEQTIKKLFDCGINLIVANGFNDISLFFIEKYKMMALKIQSKFDLQRIAKTCGAVILDKIKNPNLEEIGKCDIVSVRSFGTQKITLFQQEALQSKIFTIIARANSTSLLDYMERIIYRSTSVFKTILRDNRFVPGAGACELEMYRRMTSFSFEKFSGTKQFIFQKFAASFESIPRTLLENSGHDIYKILSFLHLAHSQGNEWEGVNINSSATINAKINGIWDSFSIKYWAIRNAIDAFTTILTVDQIVMAKKVSKNIEE